MHKIQLYIEEDIFIKAQHASRSQNISISEFIIGAIKNKLQVERKSHMKSFFDRLEPLDSFKEIDSVKYVNEMRSKND